MWAAILLIFWTITTARICVRWGVNDIDARLLSRAPLISRSQQSRKEDYEQINPDWDPRPPSAFRPLIVNAAWLDTSLVSLQPDWSARAK